MRETTKGDIGRRVFLKNVCAAAAASSFFGIQIMADARFSHLLEDTPGTHNMLVVGEKAVFLSHLPMFDKVNRTKTSYTSQHRYQVLLEAAFSRAGNDLQSVYMEDRARNQTAKMYTLNPEEFVLPRLDTSHRRRSPLSSFTATIFRGHLERGGQPIDELKEVTVDVKRVLHFREFDPKGTKPSRLEYLLFGKPEELFLSHFISKPPDFDQILSVKIGGHDFTDAELSKGIRLAIPSRPNSAPERIKVNQQISGALIIGPRPQRPPRLQITAVREFYFEEGEMLIPPTFDPTKEEKLSGFE